MWHIAFTREFVEDFEGHYESLVPHYMRFGYHDRDRDVYHWYHWSICWAARLWHWWINNHWIIEHLMIERNIFYLRPGDYYKNWEFNDNWRGL